MNRKTIKYILSGLVILLCAGITACLVTYNPGDLSQEQYPQNLPLKNLGGAVGAHIAHFLYHWFGFSTFVVLGILVYWSAAAVLSEKIENKSIKVFGAAVLIASACGLLESLLGTADWVVGWGGIIGKSFVRMLTPFLGRTLFCVLSACLFYLSLCLTTDVRLIVLTLNKIKALACRLRGSGKRAPSPKPALSAISSSIASAKEEASKAKEEPEPKEPPVPEEPEIEEEPSPPAAPIVRKKDPSGYRLPGANLLTPAKNTQESSTATLRGESETLCRTLNEFGIGADVVNIEIGPVVVQYQLELAAGTKVHKVMALSDDLAMALKATSVRIVAPIPGKSAVGIEVPNKNRSVVCLRELFESSDFDRSRYQIPMLMGKDCTGKPVFADLADMPHLLIAGATGSGKTVCINSIIMSMIMTQYPDDLKLLLVDPKMVEMAIFKGIPHLISPVVTDMKNAATVLDWAATKMDERYDVLAEAGVRALVEYNALGEKELAKRSERELPPHLPYIVIIIDELADLMSVAAKEIETSITRLAQKSRAVGIHIILATQRPSVDVITGLIKSNLPTRVSFRVTSKIDSRTILDRNGGDKLLGQGDMLMLPPGSTDLVRAQGTYVSDEDVRRVVEFIKAQAEPVYYEELTEWERETSYSADRDDALYHDSIRIVLETQRGSASLLQRRLSVGYTRAARLVEMMEEDGIVGSHKEAQARKVLLTLEEWEQQNKASEDQQPSQ